MENQWRRKRRRRTSRHSPLGIDVTPRESEAFCFWIELPFQVRFELRSDEVCVPAPILGGEMPFAEVAVNGRRRSGRRSRTGCQTASTCCPGQAVYVPFRARTLQGS